MSYNFAVRPIVDLLRRKSPAPEYLLLLDGLNEVSTQTIEATLDDGGKTKATVYEMIRVGGDPLADRKLPERAHCFDEPCG